MRDEERFKLLHGPYHSPQVKIGDWLECEVRGPLVMKDWSEGRIPWPSAGGKRSRQLIVCADLARAVRMESNQAVMYWWGVSKVTVTKWRRALEVQATNDGTRQLHRRWWPEVMTEAEKASGLAASHQARMERLEDETAFRHRNHIVWTPEEDALLGTMPDPLAAQRLSRSLAVVSTRRLQLGIAAYNRQPTQRPGQSLIGINPQRLRQYRVRKKWLHKDVAARASLTPNHYSKLERGASRYMRAEEVERLARALECNADDLVDPDLKPAEQTPARERRKYRCQTALSSDERFHLQHGPYQPPPVHPGNKLRCEMRGDVAVRDWTAAPIPWPCADLPGKPIILCGDLVRAVRVESAMAIQHWWGVGPSVVGRWRQVLSVEKFNAGTRHLYGEWMKQKITPEVLETALQRSHRPEVRAQAVRTRRERGLFQKPRQPWSKAEDAPLGTLPDPAVGRQLGRPAHQVGARRRQLGIDAHGAAIWKTRSRRLMVVAVAQLRDRRFALGWSQAEVCRRAGVQPYYYSRIETGRQKRVTPQMLERIARALDCDAATLREAAAAETDAR